MDGRPYAELSIDYTVPVPKNPSWSWRCGSYEESNEEDMVMGVETFPILDDVVLPPAKGRAARPRKSSAAGRPRKINLLT